MRRIVRMMLTVGIVAASGPLLAQELDVKKAVACQALAQQFGDSIKTAKADDATKKTATDLAKEGDQACNGREYDSGMAQLREALQQVGLKVSR